MYGPHIARELMRRRDEEIARRVARPRHTRPARLSEAMPAVSILAAAALLAALGAPVLP